ncbi:hypothetical protein BV898_07732 [Hypsibius exemplaris]|uniref:Receptor ligand binding region domain-containing protein n=1 Tax=Hypsibius exemplaris TaxID=2072580 RepID=A0A1W0WSG9_HYPEX|nr:hypothetical protein BV898_07732 [Hypsibius exemplaris]
MQFPLFVASSYAAVVVVSQVADQLRRQEPPFDFSNGAALARQFLSRTFETRIGNVTFDELGQRIPQVLVGYYDSTTDNFKPFLTYPSPSGDFEGLQNQQPIPWPGPWPVPSVPFCGFQGLGCMLSGYDYTIPTVAGSVAVVAMIIILTTSIAWRLRPSFWETWWFLNSALLSRGKPLPDGSTVRHHQSEAAPGRA